MALPLAFKHDSAQVQLSYHPQPTPLTTKPQHTPKQRTNYTLSRSNLPRGHVRSKTKIQTPLRKFNRKMQQSTRHY